MSARPSFPTPSAEARALAYRIVGTVSGVLKNEPPRLVAEATIYASAIVLLASVKPDASMKVLQESAIILETMAAYPRELSVIQHALKGKVGGGAS